jgi:hypothetical protein
MEQMLSARAGHSRFALRLLQIGQVKFFSSNSANKIMPHFRRGLLAKDLRLTIRSGGKLAAPPANLLPASTEVEKLTYAMFMETAL